MNKMFLGSVTGPVRYEKVVWYNNPRTIVMHFFSDDHIRTSFCNEANSVTLTQLIHSTLEEHATTDIVFEGYEHQKIVAGNYLQDFRNAFPGVCWEKHECDNFPLTTFWSTDIRNRLFKEWLDVIRTYHSEEKRKNIHFRFSDAPFTFYLLNRISSAYPKNLVTLYAWMLCIIYFTDHVAMSFSEFDEDLIKWIRLRRPIYPLVKDKLVSIGMEPIGYDEYVLFHMGSVATFYEPFFRRWLDLAYQRINDNPEENHVILLSYMVDLAALRMLVSPRHDYVIIYMGHEHMYQVLSYMKDFVEMTNTSLQYTFPSPPKPIQCLNIPLVYGKKILPVLTMDDNVYSSEPIS